MGEGLKFGEWIASAAISKLADQVGSYISDQYEYQQGGKEKLESLRRSLRKIKAVMDAAERKGMEEDPNLKSWLNELKDAAYEAEDVLDLFEYKRLEQEAESSSQVRKGIKRALMFVKCLFFSDDELNELGNVVKKFDKLTDEGIIEDLHKVVELFPSTQTQNEIPEWRQTTSILTEPEVVGRSSEMDRLLNLLLVPSDASGSNSEKNFSVVSIVGIGGVGKTTLAQSVYGDPRVKEHIDLKAWVCVSKPYSIRRVMIEIIESASINRPHDLHSQFNLDSIQMILNQGLEGKKFLIVLDDIWDLTRTDWEKLCSTFRSGKGGSRIVVTTRIKNVADTVKSKESINLVGLEDEVFWKLFRCYAFGDVNPEDHPKLECIGKEIAKKLGRLPLAAKTVGGVLRSRMEERHWMDVLENKLWEDEREKDGILASLRLSYHHLPAHLKQCFVYCSLFPKDYRFIHFEMDKLIHYWVALGYIQRSKGKKSLEDIGREYFTELASRSFFQKVNSYYVIHDLLHDLAESISEEEIFRQEGDNLAGLRIPKRIRHLYVSSTEWVKVLDQVWDKKRLRSLVVSPRYDSDDRIASVPSRELEATFIEFKGLRILLLAQPALNPSTQVVGEWIGGMLHLRYLQLPEFAVCPDSCSKLYHLQVLSSCILQFRESLNKTFNKLTNLRHMPLSSDCDIASIGHLTSLQELRMTFKVKKEEGYKISELRNLRQLRGPLRIVGLGNVASREEAREAELDNKEHIDQLELGWGLEPAEIHKEHEGVLEGLQPHSNLERLIIWEFLGTKTPSWLNKTSISSIERIELRGCYFVEVLPPLGELPFLKVLCLRSLHSLETVGTEIYGEASLPFPSLEELDLFVLRKLREWSAPEDGRVLMPRLRVLKIEGCGNLKGPIPFHSSLTKFHAGFDWSGYDDENMSLLTSYIPANSSLDGLQSLSIGPLRHVQTFTDEQGEWFQSLTSLKELTFTNCSYLQSLPNTIRSLSSLKTLRILWCEKMQQLPEDGPPPSLEALEIFHGKGLGDVCKWRREGSEWYEIMHGRRVVGCPPAAVAKN